MTPENVIRANALLDRRESISNFLAAVPDGADSVTITFRAGKKSKSCSFKDKKLSTNMKCFIMKMMAESEQELRNLNVQLDSNL